MISGKKNGALVEFINFFFGFVEIDIFMRPSEREARREKEKIQHHHLSVCLY